MDANQNSCNRRDERYDLEAPVEFIVEADVLKASAINVSQTGILFTTETPVYISMRVTVDGKREERRARLVWANQDSEPGLKVGLEFLQEEHPPTSDLL
jgi:hypothetical protein